MNFLYILLLAVPLAVYFEFIHGSPVLVFLFSSLAIIPLAGLMGKSTEELAIHAGPRVGGFLNATFGNATELIITIFALREGFFSVVKASLAGSILGNILLVLGFSAFLGGLKHKTLNFNSCVAQLNTSLLFMVITSLVIPAVFSHAGGLSADESQTLSLVAALILLAAYLISLYFSFHTHKHLFHTSHSLLEKAEWRLSLSLGVLLGSVVLVALMSDFLVVSLRPVVQSLGVSEAFIGVILIPIIGNAAEHSTAVLMALKQRMDLSLEIAIGSSTQIALLVTPLLVLISYLFGRPMNLIFDPLELTAIILAVLMVNYVIRDGDTNYLEGLLLLFTFIIMAVAFYLV
ncbi:calcium/proton exchanger [Desulfofundulus thermobenzoicus]|uniref:Ca(2+)/H(+) antiporter n=1 Tax=Desulfofundulus thermobenzoicus TaxID=29376 RepID=A0A6N7IPX1_9FIRM|nr:calcium/proton exchanger [Desulfofundulus thermobenzoicus]MQL51268.1 calcium/proton exchanger [Desulfofundulus thermobenzoicus]HHW44369.1 calcium/proton exchanger [Desulfotomaculum sp.]